MSNMERWRWTLAAVLIMTLGALVLRAIARWP